MNVLKSFAIAFSMYSRIPVPVFEWKKENMKYSICFFPFVGLIIAGAMTLVFWLTDLTEIELPLLSRIIFVLVIPIIVSGGIHLDGFMDTLDALSSYVDREKKLGILEDPHIGAFAVIRTVVYFAVFLATSYAIVCANKDILLLFSWFLCFFLARILSGIAVVSFKCAKNSGTLYTFAEGAEKARCRFFLIMEMFVCIGMMIFYGRILGIIEITVSGFVFLYYYLMARKIFGGITGDLAGYFVCLCELMSSISFMVGIIIV